MAKESDQKVTKRVPKTKKSDRTPFADLLLRTLKNAVILRFGRPLSAQCFPSCLLRWHVCRVNFFTKDFFELRIFLRKMLRNFPEIFEPLFCGSNPGKFTPNFPLNFPNFPAKNQKKITDELLQERRENACIHMREHVWKKSFRHRSRNPQFPHFCVGPRMQAFVRHCQVVRTSMKSLDGRNCAIQIKNR